MLVNILSAFRYAHGGIRVVEYEPGSAVNLLDDAAKCAIANGWAEPYDPPKMKSTVVEKEKPKRRATRKK